MKSTTNALLASFALTWFVTISANVTLAAEKYTVDFRLTQWKTLHFDLEKTANQRYKTLKSLGCEVKKHAHNGHTDVSYRQVKWQTLAFKTDKEAHQWERWLKVMGFQTRHVH